MTNRAPRTKRWRRLAWFLAFALVVAACSDGDDQPAQTTTTEGNGTTEAVDTTQAEEDPREAVEIVFWASGGQDPDPDQEAMVAEFEADHPNITVSLGGVPFAQYDQSSQTIIEAGEGPNVLMVNSVSLGQFVDNGLLQPIDDLLENTSITADRFYQGPWQSVNIDGSVWGLPFDTGTRVLVYSKQMFADAGVEEFGERATWEEILSAAEAITDPASGIAGWGYAAGDRWLSLYDGFGHFAVQNDANFFDSDGTITADSEEVLETLVYYDQLTDNGPVDAINYTALAEIEQGLLSGNVAMYLAGWWSLNSILDAEPDFDYGLTIPGNTTFGSTTGGWIVSIPNHVEGAEREAVATFIEWLFDPVRNAEWTGFLPNQPDSPTDKFSEDRYQPFLEVLPDSRHPLPLYSTLPELADVLHSEIQRMLLDEITPEEAQTAIVSGLTNVQGGN